MNQKKKRENMTDQNENEDGSVGRTKISLCVPMPDKGIKSQMAALIAE